MSKACDTALALRGSLGEPRRMLADQDIRMIDGLLFVSETYRLRREITALPESRRTDSYWVRTRICDATGEVLEAEILLNHATLKDSCPGYAEAAAR